MSEGKERWVLLDGPVSSNHIPSILGCVVAFPRDPITEYSPNNEPSKDSGIWPIVTTELIKDLHDKPITFTDLETIKLCAREGKARLKVASVLDAHATRKTENFVRYAANEVVRYVMPNPKLKLQRLWENAQYREGVLQMFKENAAKSPHGLPMVTGILTCRRLSVVRTSDKSWSWMARSRLPLIESLGDYLGFFGAANPEASVEGSRVSENSLALHLDEEVIFALAYDHVCLKQEIDERKGGHVSRIVHRKYLKAPANGETKEASVQLGDRVLGDIGYFGDGGESEVDEEDDSTTHGFQEQVFASAQAVLDFEFDAVPDNAPVVVAVAGEVGDVHHIGNGLAFH
jgi:hypothetical protein